MRSRAWAVSSRALIWRVRTASARSTREVVRKSMGEEMGSVGVMSGVALLAWLGGAWLGSLLGRWGQSGQGLAQVDADRNDAQGGDGDPAVHVALDVGPALGEGAVDNEVVDHLVGDGGQGGLAVAGGPGVPHGLEDRAPPQPAVE